jgi:pyruvate/2-oxoglutarate dehydrogenase complex dihydrolipoamide dehydrogenase (E3) component
MRADAGAPRKRCSVAERVDVVVLGMGPGGEALAGDLCEAGMTVVGVEGRLLGGECPYYGCVPSKMMLRAAGLLAEARRVPQIAGEVSVKPEWSLVAKRIREEATDDWNDRAAVERFESKGGRFVRGWGHIAGPGRVKVGEREFEATRALVIDTGTQPWAPPVPGLDEAGFWTNREAIEAAEVPESLIVLGSGAVGMELTQVFARFGSAVMVVEPGPHILPHEEPESAAVLADSLRADGVEVLSGVKVEGAKRDAAGVSLKLGGEWTKACQHLLIATGRRADLSVLGVGSIGLDESARFISVDDHLRAAPGVWAIGDVTGVGPFTHVSVYQASIAVADILGKEVPGADYHALPRVTFTDPEIGSVGLTEQQARNEGVAVRTGIARISDSARGWIHKAGNNGFIKLVEDSDSGVLVGATSAGPAGGEVLGMLELAVQRRVPTAELRRLIFAYPTFTRAIEDALKDLDKER